MPATTDGRPDPDELLQRIQVEERGHGFGQLKVFLGYASGVGKSFRMLDEGRRRKQRGEDVVIGALQRKMDARVEALIPCSKSSSRCNWTAETCWIFAPSWNANRKSAW